MPAELILADTNLFLHFLTNDIPEQADQVVSALQRAAKGEIKLVVSSLVIAELVWTMESFYRLPRQAIQEKILAILNTPGLIVENAGCILRAMLWYVEKNVDYIDAYNAAWLLSQGGKTIFTFDLKHFNRLEGIAAQHPH